nr:hypothetical protein [Tanacetum cinerariifolium]
MVWKIGLCAYSELCFYMWPERRKYSSGCFAQHKRLTLLALVDPEQHISRELDPVILGYCNMNYSDCTVA